MKTKLATKQSTRISALLVALLSTVSCSAISGHQETTAPKIAPSPATEAALDPNDGGAGQMTRYCRKVRNSGNLALAAGMCERAHQIDPTHPEPLLELGSILEQMGKPETALKAYQRVLDADERHEEARYRLAKNYIALKDYDLAMRHFQTLIDGGSKDPRVYNGAGIASGMLGDHAKAQEIFEAGLDVAPNDRKLKNNLALSLVLNGRYVDGVAMLEALAEEPNADPTTRENLALAYGLANNQQGNPMTASAESIETRPMARDLTPTPIETRPVGRELAEVPANSFDDSAAYVAAEQNADTMPTPVASQPMPTSEPAQATIAASEFAIESEGATDSAAGSEGVWPLYRSADKSTQPAEPAKSGSDLDSGPYMSSQDITPPTSRQLAALPEPTSDDTKIRRPIPAITSAPADTTSGTMSATTSGTMSAATSGTTSGTMTSATSPSPAATASESMASATTSSDGTSATVAMTPQSGDYMVQFASYRSEEGAWKGWKELSASASDLLASQQPVIQRADLGAEKGIYFRLRSQPTDRDTARNLCQSMKDRGMDCLVVKNSETVAAASTN